jgi:hypothetical protein
MPAALTNKLHLVRWHDIFALVDYGQARPTDYVTLCEIVVVEAPKHPRGIGALIIIPSSATPPSDDARVAMNNVLRRLGPALRCLCWLVEGAGFQGAMVRGVLTGVKMFGRLPYETHVSTHIEDAIGWILLRLDDTTSRIPTVADGVRWIEEGRRRSERERPPHLP